MSEAKAVKPMLRGFHHATIKKNLIVSLVLCTAICGAMKIFYNDAKKQKYADFYKNYDATASFERMKAAGLLQSAPPK